MFLILAIGIPVLLLFGGALLAFSFPTEAEDPVAAKQPEAEAPRPLVFFQPLGWSQDLKEVPVEEIIFSIEAHLRNERKAARLFAEDPSRSTLLNQ